MKPSARSTFFVIISALVSVLGCGVQRNGKHTTYQQRSLSNLSSAQLVAGADASVTATTQIVVTNLNDSGAGSLRAAIDQANASTEVARISFNVQCALADCLIRLNSPLPQILRPMVLDGSIPWVIWVEPLFAPGYSETLPGSIVIDGSNAGAQANGLDIAPGVRNVTIKNFWLVKFGYSGIYFESKSGSSTATNVLAQSNGLDGITVFDADSILFDGVIANQNGTSGVSGRQNGVIFLLGGNHVLKNAMLGSGSYWISGSRIDFPDGNLGHGLTLSQSSNNQILGKSEIFSNQGHGIYIDRSDYNQLVGNNLGFSIENNGGDGIHVEVGQFNVFTGLYVDSNKNDGIYLNASNSVIGGPADAQKNYIWSSGNVGLLIAGPGNQIQHTEFSSNGTNALVTVPKLKTIWALDNVFKNGPLVFSNADSGPGTLRQALLDAANEISPSGVMKIAFALPDDATTISLSSELPLALGDIVIDGRTQPGFAGKPLVRIDGTNAGPANGLTISSINASVYGLMITNFKGSGIVDLVDAADVFEQLTLAYNYVGTDGNVALGNAGQGIYIWNRGGMGYVDINHNLISGNRQAGFAYNSAQANDSSKEDVIILSNNIVGMDRAIKHALPNNVGISFWTGGKTQYPSGGFAVNNNTIIGNKSAPVWHDCPVYLSGNTIR